MATSLPPTLRINRMPDGDNYSSACDREATAGPYHDGELSAAARREFEDHVAGCPACAAELTRVRAVSRWLEPLRQNALTPVEKSDLARDTRDRAMAVERQELAAAGGHTSWVRWLTAAAAAVFLFSAVQLFLAQRRPGDLPPAPSGDPVWTGERPAPTPGHRGPTTGRHKIPGGDADETGPGTGGNDPAAQPESRAD